MNRFREFSFMLAKLLTLFSNKKINKNSDNSIRCRISFCSWASRTVQTWRKAPRWNDLVPFLKGKMPCLGLYLRRLLFSLPSSNLLNLIGFSCWKSWKAKKIKYAPLAENFIFFPIAVETTGCFGKDSLTFLKRLGCSLMKAKGDPKEMPYLFKKIFIALLRGSYCSIVNALVTLKMQN